MIEIINLTKTYNKKIVLDKFNATFLPGANCLMGDSGSGKTTLSLIMLGLSKPDSGEVRGVSNKKVSCVFQENRLIEELSAFKNLSLVCNKQKNEEIRDLLSQMGLKDSIDDPVSTLSGGMKRRVAIARAIINPSDIYIFDEPFKGLDDALKDSIIEIVKKRTQNSITIYITHDLSDVKSLDARLVKLH
jgi:NitT/TauT family transport system ATP-binding protein